MVLLFLASIVLFVIIIRYIYVKRSGKDFLIEILREQRKGISVAFQISRNRNFQKILIFFVIFTIFAYFFEAANN